MEFLRIYRRVIFVLRDGRIVERGSFDELVVQGNLFAERAKGQFGSAKM